MHYTKTQGMIVDKYDPRTNPGVFTLKGEYEPGITQVVVDEHARVEALERELKTDQVRTTVKFHPVNSVKERDMQPLTSSEVNASRLSSTASSTLSRKEGGAAYRMDATESVASTQATGRLAAWRVEVGNSAGEGEGGVTLMAINSFWHYISEFFELFRRTTGQR
ncbi:hypothetical protein Pmar_PMAR024141 [Perkinsus marinus ATCC 50983]|uniref:Uncharacterized protein n=1 Tax=Perkinsus marinus (strain ATCC 50983 / TXsc) TaxID=423536 RepID=C5L2A5_PERM5|nr:hypothetical protein Pmar_PMAR024141 [Perkinsus marinus ATCC 50983]EER09117.1 hypothetical protein Pmar_PMAR024141 [Perkinsus marinus ATCC 50983]|eukprot:XP_002777301.1 hypothetical protein Pmar_PMAR024141 [Perkinsus marinus ATCC 50983]